MLRRSYAAYEGPFAGTIRALATQTHLDGAVPWMVSHACASGGKEEGRFSKAEEGSLRQSGMEGTSLVRSEALLRTYFGLPPGRVVELGVQVER